jgi:serine/threonine protein kinase
MIVLTMYTMYRENKRKHCYYEVQCCVDILYSISAQHKMDNFQELQEYYRNRVFDTDIDFKNKYGPSEDWTIIGEGEESVVFSTLEGDYVVKVLKVDGMTEYEVQQAHMVRDERVAREFRIPKHPNVTKTYRVSPSYTLEPKRDGDLGEYIHDHEMPSLRMRLRLCRGVAAGIAACHLVKVAHLDVKPENILMHGGVATIGDFGASADVDESDAGVTEGWAPSVLSGKRSMLADAYSLAFVMIAILSWKEEVVAVCSDFVRKLRAASGLEEMCAILVSVFEEDRCFFPDEREKTWLGQDFMTELKLAVLGTECGEGIGNVKHMIRAIDHAIARL